MQQKWIILILRYFDFWGCCTEFAITKRYEKCYLLIFVLHLILIFITAWSIVIILERPTNDVLGHINDTIKLGSILFVCLFAVIESFCKRNKQHHFWVIFQTIQQKFHSNRLFGLKWYSVKFSLFTLSSIISTLYTFSIITFDWNFWLVYNLVTKIYQNRILCYLFYVELIQSEWNTVKQLSITSKRNYSSINIKRNMTMICNYYHSIRELSEYLNVAFSWSNAVTILFSFGFILTELNWVYWKWYNGNEMNNMIG